MSKKQWAGLLMTAHIYFAQYGLIAQFATGIMFLCGLDMAFEAATTQHITSEGDKNG